MRNVPPVLVGALLLSACGGSVAPSASQVPGPDASIPHDAGRPSSDAATRDVTTFDVTPAPDAARIDAFADAPATFDAGPEGDASDPICVALAQMSLENPVWSTPAIAPGDQATLTITLTNNSSQIFSFYPQVLLIPDNDAVTPMGQTQPFGIEGNMSTLFQFAVMFGSSIAGGTDIQFHAEAASLNHVRCPGAGSLDFDLTLQ